MIIKDKSFLRQIQAKGDDLVFEHAQDVSPVIGQAQEIRMFSDNGWTQDRSIRQIGAIPELVFQRLMIEQPDVARDMNKLKEWLMSPEGEPYRTVRAVDTGRSGKTIVK